MYRSKPSWLSCILSYIDRTRIPLQANVTKLAPMQIAASCHPYVFIV